MSEPNYQHKAKDQTHWYNKAWPYRRKLTVNLAQVAGTNLQNFPVLVQLTDINLKSALHGGHVAHPEGNDIIFTDSDGLILLDHELDYYDSAQGSLEAWVKLPVLGHAISSGFYIYYGNFGSKIQQHPEDVWGADYIIETSNDLSAITVEVWARTQSAQAETMQVLVSQWNLLSSFNTFDTFDLSTVSGLSAQSFAGAVFDGRYIYFVPAASSRNKPGRVLRYDSQGKFDDAASWSTYPVEPGYAGYYGAAFDSRYIYFVPYLANNSSSHQEPHGRILRYDTTGNFNQPQSWCTFALGDSVAYQGAAFDGRYVYFCPSSEAVTLPDQASSPAGLVPSGRILQFDTWQEFTDPASYTTYNAAEMDSIDTVGYKGAVFDGRYVYFIPSQSQGALLRYDTLANFLAPSSWKLCQPAFFPDGEMGLWAGAVFDGRYIHLVPSSSARIVRYDTQADSSDDRAGWTCFDASQIKGSNTTGYEGAVFDGKYIYFIPGPRAQANVLRYDTEGEFTDNVSWSIWNAITAAGFRSNGFRGAAFDGRHVYFVPSCGETGGGKFANIPCWILRYDTTGSQASFSLQYSNCGHNGGLTGAIVGPNFLVNTDLGVLRVQSGHIPQPGWHHLAGVYDGSTISLVLDGEVVLQRSGQGAVQFNCDSIIIGQIPSGQSYFRGNIQEVRISKVARSMGWLKTSYNNLHDPKSFCQMGPEESPSGKG